MTSAVALLPNLNRPSDVSLAAPVVARPVNDASATARPGLVQPVRTPLTTDQASSLIGNALERVTGEKPKPETVAILTAQWAHETGHGASMFNYNFAGIKGAGPTGLSVSQRTREGYGSSERTITDNFRAYQTAEEGARDYVSLLKSRFPGAFEAAKSGDPTATVHALKQEGYFTGDEVAYTRSVTQLAQQIGPASLQFTNTELPALPVDYASGLGSVHASSGALASLVGSGGTPAVDTATFTDNIMRAALNVMSAPTEDQDRARSIT
ncbi:MAG TPA: glucosaminidase domain-containing protein [Polyangiaceae bacterium]|nr:glucosaminidase domain-containing protein [Polyangiaceae bacterium]